MNNLTPLKHLITLLAGALFGFGIHLSGMTNPNTVIQFLDVLGPWNNTLLFVLGSAVITTYIGYKWVLKHTHPLFASAFDLPTKSTVDVRLLIGASLFGIGWGLAGYCPGAAIAALSSMHHEAALFVVSMLAGIFISQKLR